MWFSFAAAAYAAISNDSIQTLGCFLSSSKGIHYLVIFAYIASIFVVTTLISFIINDGDVS